jgi:hypothetical protein
MSGHWRFCVTAFLLFAGTSPASSNPLTDLFNFAPKEAAAPAPAQEECVLQPGKSTAPGQHWVYRHDGHRKCWFQADEATTVSVKKQIHHHAAKRPAIAPEENEAALRKETVLDARAQLLSTAAAGAPLSSTASAPEVVDTASVPAREAVTRVPAAPVAAPPTIEPLKPDHATPRSVDVEMLLAASALDKDMGAPSVPPTAPGATSVAGANDWELMAAGAGTALIALGFVFLVGSLLASRFFVPRETPIRRA